VKHIRLEYSFLLLQTQLFIFIYIYRRCADINKMNNTALESRNDLFFIKLLKQAPIHTIMMLHERIKNASILNDKYSVICEIINKQFNTNFSPVFTQQQIEFFSSLELFRGYLMFSTDVDQLIIDYQIFTNYSIRFRKIEPMSKKCILCSDNDNVVSVYQ